MSYYPKKKTIKRDKAFASKMHSRHRALQRYNLWIGDVHDEIVNDIQNGNTLYSEKQTNSRSIHLVKVKGKILPVIYDSKRHVIVTVLPKDSPELSAYYKSIEKGRHE